MQKNLLLTNCLLMIYKKISLFLVAAMLSLVALAQAGTKSGIAPFKITLANGQPYTYTQLKKNVPTVLVYFSPTCEHCKDFTAELLKHEKELQQHQIVMVGYEPLSEVKKFADAFNLSKKPFIKIGTEGYTFIVQKFYNVQRFPFVALYNRQMKLVKTISPVVNPENGVKEIIALK